MTYNPIATDFIKSELITHYNSLLGVVQNKEPKENLRKVESFLERRFCKDFSKGLSIKGIVEAGWDSNYSMSFRQDTGTFESKYLTDLFRVYTQIQSGDSSDELQKHLSGKINEVTVLGKRK
ncbi:MAG: hypothetical protein ABFQ65_01260 [Nanoarchaeota archaeon]